MARIINTWNRPIPDPKPLEDEEQDKLSDLQRRAHLQHKNKDGDLPLRGPERKELAELTQRWNDRKAPDWQGITLRLAPHGQPGCVVELRSDIARALVEQHNAFSPPGKGRLRLMAEDEKNPPGVSTVRGPAIPSRNVYQFGVENPEDLQPSLSAGLNAEIRRLQSGEASPMAAPLPGPAHPS